MGDGIADQGALPEKQKGARHARRHAQKDGTDGHERGVIAKLERQRIEDHGSTKRGGFDRACHVKATAIGLIQSLGRESFGHG